MAKELKRLQELDKMYGLQFADMAENLEEKFKRDREENVRLLYEVDGIPRKHQESKDIPILGSGGLYISFGNNQIQEKINRAHHCIVQKCEKS